MKNLRIRLTKTPEKNFALGQKFPDINFHGRVPVHSNGAIGLDPWYGGVDGESGCNIQSTSEGSVGKDHEGK